MLGGHVRAVFTIVTIIFIFCVATTLKSVQEIPLGRLEMMSRKTVVTRDCEDVKEDLNGQTTDSDKCQISDAINRTASYGAFTAECGDEQKNVEKLFLLN